MAQMNSQLLWVKRRTDAHTAVAPPSRNCSESQEASARSASSQPLQSVPGVPVGFEPAATGTPSATIEIVPSGLRRARSTSPLATWLGFGLGLRLGLRLRLRLRLGFGLGLGLGLGHVAGSHRVAAADRPAGLEQLHQLRIAGRLQLGDLGFGGLAAQRHRRWASCCCVLSPRLHCKGLERGSFLGL